MKILKLLLFEECNRSCPGCCNKQWDLKKLPAVDSFDGYDQIILTGGEPMLKPELIMDTIMRIKQQTDAEIILYTAKTDTPETLSMLLYVLDGLTVTLHDQKDVEPFLNLRAYLGAWSRVSLRLNVFKGVSLDGDPAHWKIKDNIEWIEDCPLPDNETFMRL